MTTLLAGFVSRTFGSSGGAGGAGTNTGPIRPGAYGRPAPRFVEPCWLVLYTVSPIQSPVPSEPDPCRIGKPYQLQTEPRNGPDTTYRRADNLEPFEPKIDNSQIANRSQVRTDSNTLTTYRFGVLTYWAGSISMHRFLGNAHLARISLI